MTIQERKVFEKHRKQKGLTSKKEGTKKAIWTQGAVCNDFRAKAYSKSAISHST
jgi:hypothetical protein